MFIGDGGRFFESGAADSHFGNLMAVVPALRSGDCWRSRLSQAPRDWIFRLSGFRWV